MSILDIFKAFKGSKQNIPITSQTWAVPPLRNTESYLKAFGEIGWLFAVVSRIAIATSEVQWHLYDTRGGKRKEIDSHPLLDLIHYVNSFQTGQEFIELTQMYIDLVGECFWHLSNNKLGVAGEIWILPPHHVEVVPSKEKFISGYIYSIGNERIPLEPVEIIPFKTPNPANPFRGIGAVQACSIDLDSEDFAARWNRNFFYNEARPDGILKIPGTVNDADYEKVKEQWNAQHLGLMKSHKTAIIRGSDIDYKQISISAKDMDLLNLRHLTRDNILGVFGMPSSMMGIGEIGSRARVEADEYVFSRWLIKPRLTRIKGKMNEQLCPLFDKDIELDFDNPVPENRELLISEAERGVKAGYLTINEARQMLGFDTLKTGDVFLQPMTILSQPAKSIKKSILQTEDQKTAYWREFVTKAEGYERALIKSLGEMFSKQEKEALGNLKEGISPDTALINQTQARRTYKEAVRPILLEELEHAVEDGHNLINPEPEHRSKQIRPEALRWLETRIGWAAAEIGEETATLLGNQLKLGFEAGESMNDLRKRVESVFEGCSKTRALVIARTETIMASNEGALWGYEASGVVEKVDFYPAPDACDDCLSLVGEYTLSEAHGMIPVHPNCRCTYLPIV